MASRTGPTSARSTSTGPAGLLWTHDSGCRDAGGDTECCTGDLNCNVHYMPWQEMNALAMWMIEQADIARDVQLRESCSVF